jgi:hypothetical protein
MTKLMKTAALAGVLAAFLASTALELRAAEPKNDVREGQAVVTELAPNAFGDDVLGRRIRRLACSHHDRHRSWAKRYCRSPRRGSLFRGAFPGPDAGDLRSLCPRRATAGAAGPSHRRPDRNCPGPGLV